MCRNTFSNKYAMFVSVIVCKKNGNMKLSFNFQFERTTNEPLQLGIKNLVLR